MSLEKTVVPVVIGGQDAGTDPKVLAGGWSRVENAVHPRAGAIAKRPGQRSIAVTAGNTRITRTAGGALLWGGPRPVTLAAISGAEHAVSVPAGWGHYRAEVKTYGQQPIGACAAAGSILATAGIYGGEITTRDSDTGAVIAQTTSTIATQSRRPAFVAYSGALHYWGGAVGASAGNIVRRVINTATGAIGAEAPIVGSVGTGPHVSVAMVTRSGVDYACVAYKDGSVVKLAACPGADPALATIYSVVTLPAIASGIEPPIAVFAVGDAVGVAWVEEFTIAGPLYEWEIKAAVIDPATGASVVSTTLIRRIYASERPPSMLSGVDTLKSTRTAGTVALIVYDWQTYATGYGTSGVFGVSTHPPLRMMDEAELVNTAGVGSLGGLETRGRAQPLAPPVKLASGRYMMPVYSQAWGYAFADGAFYRDTRINWLVSGDALGEGAWVGRTLTDSAKVLPVNASGAIFTTDAATAFLAADGSIYVAVRTLQRADPSPGGAAAGRTAFAGRLAFVNESDTYAYAIVRMAPDSGADAIESDGSLYIGGALPSRYDGQAIFEHGYSQAPDAVIAANSSTTGALTGAAQYRYLAVYEFIDATGKREQGRPGDTPTVVSGDNAYDLIAAGLTATNRGRMLTPWEGVQPYVVFYRTVGNQEQPFYRVGSAVTDLATGYTAKLTDTLADADIVRNETLYTTGGIVEYSGPPPYDRATLHGTRHCCVSVEDGRLYYSLPATRGQPFHHSAILSANASVGLERVTALRSHADRLVLFTPSALSVIDGTGYNALGVGDNFREPYPIIGAPGCTTSRSIVAIPGMLAYGAPDSLWALNSRFQSEPIGGPVQYYLDTQTIVDAAALPDRTLAVWACASGPAIVYDYAADAWGVWTNHDSLAACAYAGGTLARLASARVYLTDGTRYDDDGAFVTMRAITGWLAVSAWQRIYELLLLGQARDTANLKVALGYDHDPAWTDTFTFALAGLRPFGVEAYYGDGLALADYADQAATLRVFPSRQKCGALRVQISDAQVGGAASARGYELSALQLLAGAKTGVKRVSPARQIRS